MNRLKKHRNVTAARVARHRRKAEDAGLRRVEISIPAADARLVREVAAILRAGGKRARLLRDNLLPIARGQGAQSGADLVAFFRASPLVGVDLVIDRDRSSGRKIDL